MGRYTGGDIALLPGDSWAVRRGAHEIRSTVHALVAARAAAGHVEDVTHGEHWRGEAFETFRQVVSHAALSPAIEHAIGRMHEAADQLLWFADRCEDQQAELRWCRSRSRALQASLAQLEASVAATPELAASNDRRAVELATELASVRRRADEVWRDHHWSVGVVRDAFDRLDDQPTFAEPPPSALERVAGAAHGFVDGAVRGAGSLTVGIAEGTRDLVLGLVEVVALLNPITAPARLHDAWSHRDQIVMVLRYAADDPEEFFGELARAMLDLDMLAADPARWVGRRIPDILLTVATAGAGRVGTTAAASVRALRGGHLADRTVGRLHRVGRMAHHGPSTADDAVGAMRTSGTVVQRLSALGADASHMARVGDLGALTRTDTASGRLAMRFDELGAPAQVARQIVGAANEEVKGFTAIPRRMVEQLPLPEPLGETVRLVLAHPMVASTVDSHLSGGLTTQLGLLDGLLTGLPALSPEMLTAMSGVAGAQVLGKISDVQQFFGDVGAAAHLDEAV